MSNLPGSDDELPASDPVYPFSRVSAPGGVPIWLTLLCGLPLVPLIVLVNPLFALLAPFGWRRLQKWINGDLQKPQVFARYVMGAWMTPDPVVNRPDGGRGRLWGGSTFSALAPTPSGGVPRHVLLPKD